MENITYKLNPSFRCEINNKGNLILHIPELGSMECQENVDFFTDLLFLINGKNSLIDIENKLQDLYYDIESEDLFSILQDLHEKNIIKRNMNINEMGKGFFSPHEIMKFDRQIKNYVSLKGKNIDDGLKFQSKIKNSVVSIIGVGGIGTYLAYSLVAMGVGEVRLIDKDEIELSNTSRQMLYDESDIGKLKIDVAAEKLSKVNPLTKIKKRNLFVNEHSKSELTEFLKGSSLIVCCADIPRGEIHYIIDEIAHVVDAPWVAYGPFHFHKVFCGPIIIPNQTQSYNDIFPKEITVINKKIIDINNRIESNIMDPFNGLASKVASIEIMKFITGYSDCRIINNRLIIDSNDWTIENFKIGEKDYVK